MPDSAPKSRARSDDDGYSALQGVGFLVAAAAVVIGVFIARPAPIGVFSRIMAWQSLGSMHQVKVMDGSGNSVTASMFIVDDKRDVSRVDVPLVFVHGFPTSSFDFKDVWPSLCHGVKRRCIAVDLLGYGLSEKPAVNYTIAMHAQSVTQALASALGGSATVVDVMAHDLGDSVMQELLVTTPGCLESSKGAAQCPFRTIAMLNGGIIPSAHHPQLSQTLLANPLVGPWAQWLMIRPVFGVAVSRVFGPQTQPSVVELDEDFALIAHNGGRAVVHAHLQYMAERRARAAEWEACLSTSLPPLLLINGPADPVSGAHVATYVAERVTGVDVQSLPSHIGHFPQREMPSRVAAAYTKWLARVTAGQ